PPLQPAGAASLDLVLTRLGVAQPPPPVEVVVQAARPPQPPAPPEPVVAPSPPPPPSPPPAPAPVFSPTVSMSAPPPTMSTPPTPPSSLPAARRAPPSQWPRVAMASVVLVVLTVSGLYLVRRRASASALAAGTGTLSVQSNPAGVPIDIDGRAYGVTPATVSLPAGTHTILLRPGGEPKAITIAMA